MNLGRSIVYVDITQFKKSEYFSEYHHFEKYDENKIYQDAPFECDYGYGKHTYVYELYNVNLMNNKKIIRTKYYIVSEEKMNDDELQKLSKYCRCDVCTRKWYDITRLFMCSCCIGCLKSSFPQQYQINKARKYIKENNITI